MPGNLPAQSVPCLAIALSKELEAQIQNSFPELKLALSPYDLEKLMEPIQPPPKLILCGSLPQSGTIAELAQLLRMNYQNTPIYLILESGAHIDRKELMKNGLNDVFFFPFDQNLFTQSLKEWLLSNLDGQKAYRSVKLVDLQPNTTLQFDTFLYMPANHKHIKYSSAGDPIETERLNRLKQNPTSSIHVASEDLQKVYEYTAATLKKLGSSASMGETERSQKLQTAVRDLISDLFSDAVTGMEGGKGVIEDCQNIVRSYISSSSKDGWYEKILTLSGSSAGNYSHSANVATYAALFAVGLGNEHVEEIGIAGLLHDIGLAKIPVELQSKPISEMTQLEKHSYEKHPEYSLEIIRERKLIIPELSQKIILQHHECFNGSGFPKGLRDKRLLVESQILAFADRFDELLAVTPGKKAKTPFEAAQELSLLMINDPSKAFIEPELMKKLLALFPASQPPSPSGADGSAA